MSRDKRENGVQVVAGSIRIAPPNKSTADARLRRDHDRRNPGRLELRPDLHGLLARGERADAHKVQRAVIDVALLPDTRQAILQDFGVRFLRERANLYDVTTAGRG